MTPRTQDVAPTARGQLIPFPIAARPTARAHADAVIVEHAGTRTAFACPEHLHAEILAAGQARARALRAANAAGARRLARLHFIIADATISRGGLLIVSGLAGLWVAVAATRLLLSLFHGAV